MWTALSKSRWLILLIMPAVILALAPQPGDPTAVSALQRADRLAADGAWREAEAALRAVAARRPRDPLPWQRLGELYALRRQHNDALTAYSHAQRLGDDSPALARDLALLHTAQGDLRRAAHYWSDYLARRPADTRDWLALAQTAIALADWPRAEDALTQALSAAPADPAAHAWLGLLHIEADPAQALPHLHRAAEDPGWAAALDPLFAVERHALASDDPAYRSALLGIALLDLAPPPPSPELPLDTRAATMLATRSLLTAVNRNPMYADAYAYLGQALDRLGHPDWALTALQYALERDAESPVALTLMGLYWDRHENPTLARHFFEVAYHQEPDNPALCLEIADTYAAEGAYTSAEVWLLFAAQIAPDDPQVWEAIASFYTNIGAEIEGEFSASRLLELAPDNARAHDLVGWALFLSNDLEQAQASITRALELDPTLASAYYHQGRLYAHLGAYDLAARSYQRAMELGVEGQLAADLARARDELPAAFHDD